MSHILASHDSGHTHSTDENSIHLKKFIDANNIKPHLNSRSAIYRELKLGQNIPDKARAIELMLQDSNLIKRPFVVKGDVGSFGFVASEFDEKWGTSSN